MNCETPECLRPARSRGLCQKHYDAQPAQRARRAEHMRKLREDPAERAKQAAYDSSPERLAKYAAHMRKRREDPTFRAQDQARAKEYLKEYRVQPENKERARVYMSRYSREYKTLPDYHEKYTRYRRKYSAGFPHSLTARLRELQGGLCAICSVKMSLRGLAPDRECGDHIEIDGRKIPRGLLCNTCNTCLGQYETYQRGRFVIEQYENYLTNTPVQRLGGL